MSVDIANTHNIQAKKIFSPLNRLWFFFWQSHKSQKNSPKKNKSSKALYELVEGLFRFTTIIFIADYLAYPHKHTQNNNTIIHKGLTRKKNYLQYWFACLQHLWENNDGRGTFLGGVQKLDHCKILKAFATILRPGVTADKKSSRHSAKNYKTLLKAFDQLIPLLELWNHYTIVSFQDYPWKEAEGATVPVLSFVGEDEPLSSLQYLTSSLYGAPGYLYLFNPETTDSLSLYPFIFQENKSKAIQFFCYYREKKDPIIEYIDCVSKQKLFITEEKNSLLAEELQTICDFLKQTAADNAQKNISQGPSGVEDEALLTRDMFYLPLETVGQYRELVKNFAGRVQAPRIGVVHRLNYYLGELFVRSFLRNIHETGMLKIMPQLGLGKEVLSIVNIVEKKLSIETYHGILEGLIHNEPQTGENLLRELSDDLQTFGDLHSQITLLEWWAKYDWRKAIERFLPREEIPPEEIFRAILKPLLESGQHQEVVEAYNTLYQQTLCNTLLNGEIGPELLKSFLIVDADQCFQICEESLNAWDMEWLDKIIDKLLEVSISKTVAILSRDQFNNNFDVSCWERLLKIYQILHKKHPEKLQFFIENVKEPVARIRLDGLYALKQKKLDHFWEIIHQVPLLYNVEQVLSTLCFFVNVLRDSRHKELRAITEKIVKMIVDYSLHLFSFLNGYYIKKQCEELLHDIDSHEMIQLQKKIGDIAAESSLFSFFLSYLCTKKLLHIDKIKDLTSLQEKCLSESYLKSQEDTFDSPQTELMLHHDSFKDNYNTVNQLLAEIAAVMWHINREESLYYLSQLIPDTLFDREDALKKIIYTNPDITLFDLNLLSDKNYEVERLQSFWLENTIRRSPNSILDLYKLIPENLKSQLVIEGLPILISHNIADAISLVQKFSDEISYDFGNQAGHIFLKLYHTNPEVGKLFLKSLDNWELTRFSEMGSALLRAFNRLSMKKLMDLYEEFVSASTSLGKEQMATLLLCAMVPRRPTQSLQKLAKLVTVIPEDALEEMVLHLIQEIATRKSELAKELLTFFYGYIQQKNFSIEKDSFDKLKQAILATLQQNKDWLYIPEVYGHRWMLFPDLLAKICRELLPLAPERALFLCRYLVEKPEIFYVLGELPFNIITEKPNIWEVVILQQNGQDTLFIEKRYKNTLFALLKTTLPRLSSTDLNTAIPYVCHSYWTNRQRSELINIIDNCRITELSISGKFALAVAREAESFDRARFEGSLKNILTDFAEDDLEAFDIEKKIFVSSFQLLLYLNPNLADEIKDSYWDQMDFIALILVHVFGDCSKQIELIQKILSVEERLETMEEIAGIYLAEERAIPEEFVHEILKTIYDSGGFELVHSRIPNIFILLLLTRPKLAVESLEQISDSQAFTSNVETILEFLTDPEHFSQELYCDLWPWLNSSVVKNSVSSHDLLYFYSQLAEQLLAIELHEPACEVIHEALDLAKMCNERETKYYLEDLVELLIVKDLSLAWQVVASYPDNDEHFFQVVSAWARQDALKAIEIAESHEDPEVVCRALSKIACDLAYRQPKYVFTILEKPKMSNHADSIYHSLAVAAVRKNRDPEKYIEKIASTNQKFQVYCQIARIYLGKKKNSQVEFYQKKFQDFVKGIESSSHPFGNMLEWSCGSPMEVSPQFLEDLSLVAPETALEIFHLYLKHDRFIDIDEAVQYLFKGISQSAPDRVVDLLQQTNILDISVHSQIIAKEAKVNPLRAMKWIIAGQQPELYSVVLDEINNSEELLQCLNLTLHPTSSTREAYLNKIVALVPYFFKIGKSWLLFDILYKLQILYPVQNTISLEKLLHSLRQICKEWEQRQRIQ